MSEYTAYAPKRACSDAGDNVFARRVPLAMAYVRDQDWERPLRARDALNCGTAFRSLVMPFTGAEVDDEKQC